MQPSQSGGLRCPHCCVSHPCLPATLPLAKARTTKVHYMWHAGHTWMQAMQCSQHAPQASKPPPCTSYGDGSNAAICAGAMWVFFMHLSTASTTIYNNNRLFTRDDDSPHQHTNTTPPTYRVHQWGPFTGVALIGCGTKVWTTKQQSHPAIKTTNLPAIT